MYTHRINAKRVWSNEDTTDIRIKDEQSICLECFISGIKGKDEYNNLSQLLLNENYRYTTVQKFALT